MVPVVDVTKNLALWKPTKQSATLHSLVSSKAVDGSKTKPNCSQTTSTRGSWWQVDLEAVYEIREVVITNVQDNECELSCFFDCIIKLHSCH